jgi:hypothetical protein
MVDGPYIYQTCCQFLQGTYDRHNRSRWGRASKDIGPQSSITLLALIISLSFSATGFLFTAKKTQNSRNSISFSSPPASASCEANPHGSRSPQSPLGSSAWPWLFTINFPDMAEYEEFEILPAKQSNKEDLPDSVVVS